LEPNLDLSLTVYGDRMWRNGWRDFKRHPNKG